MIRGGGADDPAPGRAGFAAPLAGRGGMGDAGAGGVLMDTRMPVLDGIEPTGQIAAQPDLARVHVVILTTFELDEYIFDALRAGAAGFLVKDTDAVELIRAVRVVAAGESLLSPTVTRRLIAEFAARTRTPQPRPGLDDL